MRRINLRLLAAAGLVVAVASANAAPISIHLVSIGSGLGSLTANFAWTDSVFIYGLGAGPLDDLGGFMTSSGVGAGAFTHSSNGNGFTFTSVHNTGSVVQVGNSFSVAGSWSYVNGTGAYAGLSGGGTYTINWLGTPIPGTRDFDGPGTVSFTGSLVPEPGTLAALAIGGALVARRRRRKA